MSEITWPRYNISLDCEKIEYIDHSLEYECHKKTKLDFKIVKLTNLKLGTSESNDVEFISGKKFLVFPDMPYYHAMTDKFPQLEILNEFDSGIKPAYFLDYGSEEIADFGDNFYKGVSDLYSIELGSEKFIRNLLFKTYIIEEVYFIVDELRVVKKDTYIKCGADLPPWYRDDLGYRNPYTTSNTCGGFLLSGDSDNYKELHICYVIDDIIRIGIEKLKNRILKYIPIEKEKSYGIFISRQKANDHHRQSWENLAKEWQEEFPNRIPEEVFYENFYNDKRIRHVWNNRKRAVVGEEQVAKYLDSIGFKVVEFDDMPFLQQIKEVVNTERIVSLSGSSLVNCFMADNNTSIYEICEPVDFKFNFFFHFSPIRGCINRKNSTTSCLGERNWYRISERNWSEEAIEDFEKIEHAKRVGDSYLDLGKTTVFERE